MEGKDLFSTAIIDIHTDKINVRGYPIEQLIEKLSYPQMVYLSIMGELPSRWQTRLLEAVMVGACDHSLYAPSIAVARIAATCGVTLNCAVATGINVLGDIHGGAGEKTMRLLYEIVETAKNNNTDPTDEARKLAREKVAAREYLPGFGHGQHKNDPRVTAFFKLAEEAKRENAVSGVYLDTVKALEDEITLIKGKKIPINVDGGCAALLCEIGLPWELFKGIFSLSRGIGIVSHAYEEYKSGGRLKSAISGDTPIKYTGVPERDL